MSDCTFPGCMTIGRCSALDRDCQKTPRPAPPPENPPNTGNRESEEERAKAYAAEVWGSALFTKNDFGGGVYQGALWGLRTSRAELMAEVERLQDACDKRFEQVMINGAEVQRLRGFINGLLEVIPETFAFMHLRHKIESFLVGAGHREGLESSKDKG